MVKLINKILERFGYTLYSKKKYNYTSNDDLRKMYNIDDFDIAYVRGKMNGGFKEKLIRENKKRWLDIGCGGNLEDNFIYIDTFPESLVKESGRYFRIDIVNATETEINKLGTFDLIRMQHVFEHFTPENGLKVLNNCHQLLNEGGYLLISTPDLKRFVHLYLCGKIKDNFDWALKRIAPDSPNSFYFSIFSHSLLHEKHEWCYDAEGLIYQIKSTNKYKNIVEISLNDPLANIPFTHNRPLEDVCVVAQKK